jgi:hypothetical protein
VNVGKTSAKISIPDLPAYILVIVMTVLPCNDVMLIQKSILQELNSEV